MKQLTGPSAVADRKSHLKHLLGVLGPVPKLFFPPTNDMKLLQPLQLLGKNRYGEEYIAGTWDGAPPPPWAQTLL